MSKYDTLIKGGTLIDGRNFPRRKADVGIRNGRVIEIGELSPSQALEVVDATGMIVAPGVIDMHTHYDAQLFWDPYLTLSGWHGVTSVVVGNCGFGFAPARAEDREYLTKSLTRVEAIPYDAIKMALNWDWESFPEWLDVLDSAPKGLNVLASLPLNPVMVYVMGLEAAKSREPTSEEREQIALIVREAMDAGACGWSAQITPNGNQRDFDGTLFPTDRLDLDTTLAAASAMSGYDHGFIQATIQDLSNWKFVVDRAEAIAAVSGRPLLWNQIASNTSRPNAHLSQIEWIRSCQERGLPIWPQLDVSSSSFFFTFEEFNLFDDSAAWRHATLGSREEKLAKWRDPEVRKAMREQPSFRGPELITILKSNAPRFESIDGTKLPDAARIMGYDDNVECLADMVVESELKTLCQLVVNNDDSEALAEVALTPYGVWGISDGGAHTKFLTLGAYPTQAIIEFTRNRSVVTLEEAHWRLSALPAECIGLKDRGTLVEGAAADIIIYDWENLAILDEEIAYDLPAGEWRRVRKAQGYQRVLVNGQTISIDGEFTGQHPGALLRQGRD